MITHKRTNVQIGFRAVKPSVSLNQSASDHPLQSTLRARRRELNLTQEQLADLSGVSTRFIHNLEAGKASLQMDLVLKVASTLGLELCWRLRDPSDTRDQHDDG